jgi:ATP-dependent Lhr-like helicase
MWGRLSPHPAFDETPSTPSNRRVRPTRVAPLSLFLRDDAAWLLSARGDRQESLSHAAQAVLAALRQHGASFFAELQRSTGRLASEVEDGLWELAAAGLVTADGFENLRSLIDTKRRRGEGRGRSARPRHAAGRWALLQVSNDGFRVPETEKFALLLLQRWGVLFRDLLARETLAPPWRDLLVELRRMEARGEIRGGRFVAGTTGEQYALPEAVELLRLVRRGEKSGEVTEVSTADPLNLAGIILPGPRLSALQGGSIRLVDGVPAVSIPA